MNPVGKKFISLFLVFSLVMLSVNLYAKERRGAKLIVTKKDRQQIKGELITVKPNSLLLLDAEGKDVSVDIADIRVIKIVRKSRAGIGFKVGAGVGALISLANWKKLVPASDQRSGYGGFEEVVREYGRVFFAPWMIPALISVSSGLIGLVIGAAAGKDKTFQIEGMTDSKIQESLAKLRKKARIRDYK